MKITHISYGHHLTRSKLIRLQHVAAQLGPIRARVWHQFGALQSKNHSSFRDVRNLWVKDKTFNHIPARLRNETLRDTFQDIIAYKKSSLVKVHQAISKRFSDKDELKSFNRNLRKRNKKEISYLRSFVREGPVL